MTVNAPEILELTRRLLRAFGFCGFAGVEFKRDPRDGSLRLIEINARTESGNQLAITAGVDLPWIAYQYLTGATLPLQPIVPSPRPVKLVNEEWDFQTLLILRGSAKLTFREWLASVRDAEALAIWAADDPKPFFMGMTRALPVLSPPGVPVLTFHVIGSGPRPLFYPAEMFRLAMTRLHEHGFRTMLLSELAQCLRLGLPLPAKTVALTFDEGDRSIYEIAWPILRAFNMIATIFLLPDPSRTFQGRPLISWEQAREMQQQGAEFGCHSATHPDFTRLSGVQIEQELLASSKILSHELGVEPRGFAYPFGRYNDLARRVVNQYFDFACTDRLGLVSHRSDRQLLDRVEMYYLRSAATFDLIFKRSFAWYLRARNVPRTARRMVGV